MALAAAASPRQERVFITGASSGLGQGLARWFARQRSHVFAAARRTDRLVGLQREFSDGRGRVEPVTLDVTDTGATVQTLRELDQACGGMDLVIANAGVGGMSDGRALEWKELEAQLQVNVMGAAATLSALLPQMVARGHGQLVGMSSLAAWFVPGKMWAYSATKSFVATMCHGLRLDLKGTGVDVTTIHPGFVKSELTARNQFPMPFLLETDDAVDRMGRAIRRREKVFAFPWPMALAARASGWVPDVLKQRAARNARKSP